MKRPGEIIHAVSDGKSWRPSSGWAAGGSTPPLSRCSSRCRARAIIPALAMGLAAMVVAASGQAQTETVLYRFTGTGATGTGVDGATPAAGLVRDGSGNLYGTTLYGGASGDGTVFELVNSSGGYAEKVLYNFDSFTAAGSDTAYPYAGLIMDASGNLYGTTNGTPADDGTVFELVNSSGTYTEKLLYTFTDSGGDGAHPEGGLVMDSSGNLYGTTSDGGASGFGTVFELVNSSGTYTEKVLYSFTGRGGDGGGPVAGLVIDSSGNLYGTTPTGGTSAACPGDCGTVFELINSSGGYTEKVLYSFTGGDDAYPLAGLIRDASGDLYGTTSDDGGSGGGAAFELVNLSGSYTEKDLHDFTGSSSDGYDPKAGLVMDSSGNLYGTTLHGGASGYGTVFELVNSSGTYTEKMLYSFTGAGGDGDNPVAGLVMDSIGNLYGTTAYGGAFPQTGTVFELAPASGPAVTFTPASLTFSSQTVGTTSAAQTVTLTNSGTATLSSIAISITGANGGDYSQTNTCGTSVAASANCTISVTFKPTAAGSRTASVSIADNATGSPQTVALTGTAVAAAPVVSLVPASITFNSQTIGTTSSGQDITLTDSGTGDLSITGITIAGTNAGDYSQTNNCGTSVKAGAFCNISAVFKPTATGTRTASVSIADNASGSPQTVAMSGTAVAVAAAPAVTLSPTSLTFASQTAGTSSAAQSITLTNSGTATLSSIAVSVSGTDAGDYNQTNTCGTSVAASASCTISVIFKPTAAGTRTASVSIADNATGSPQTVALTGTGATAAAGDFALSASPASLMVTAGSSGTSTLTVTPANGFNQAVTFACSGLPSQSTCTFSPASVTPSGAAATAKVTIATTATTTSMKERSAPDPSNSHRTLALAGVFACLFSLGGFRKRGNRWLSLLVLIAGLGVLGGCGGSSRNTTTQGTPPGTYTVTVTATSGSGSSALSHNTSFSLIVQ